MTPEDHAECPDFVKSEMLKLGCEVTVSALAPLVPTPYGNENITCPHGTTYWFEPTSEQIAQWVRDGVE